MCEEALKVKSLYHEKNKNDGHDTWDVSAYLQGFVGDVGDLSKLLMAKQNFRDKENLDEKLAHELSDCLWSIMVIADELNIDLEKSFVGTMKELESRF